MGIETSVAPGTNSGKRVRSALLSITDAYANMVDRQHFRRLERIYESAPSEKSHHAQEVAVALGRAAFATEIDGDERTPQELAGHTHYHRLLCDAGALAAGSLVEDRVVTVQQFNMSVVEQGYSGTVQVSARVVLAQPPGYHVEIHLYTPEGDVLAHGFGIFAPSTQELPPDPAPDADADEAPPREPAVYASIWSSPMGVLHLN